MMGRPPLNGRALERVYGLGRSEVRHLTSRDSRPQAMALGSIGRMPMRKMSPDNTSQELQASWQSKHEYSSKVKVSSASC